MPAGVGKATVDPAAKSHAMQLREYWAHGDGAKKWIGSPTPYRTLRDHLAKYVPPGRELDGLAANIYHAALGKWPGKQRGDKGLKGKA